MSKSFDTARLAQLKTDAFENIESYNDPDTPKALANFTSQIKKVLAADPEMVLSVPEYLPVALFGRIKFTPAAKLKWSHWLNTNQQPSWDEFKTSVAFNNEDMPFVKTIRDFNEHLLIEACAVIYLLTFDQDVGAATADDLDDSDEETADDHEDAMRDYDGADDHEEDGYDDQYDEITFKREGRE